jgi:hypothetical protein
MGMQDNLQYLHLQAIFCFVVMGLVMEAKRVQQPA